MALSDVKVRSAKPEAKAYKLTDGEGMVLLVHPNGSKYWRLRYRFGGKEKMLALGKYPEVSLADARARRDEARKLLANDVDPSENKKAVKVEQEQEAITFEVVARDWHASNQKWSASHSARVLKSLEDNLFAVIGKRNIAELKTRDLLVPIKAVESSGRLEVAARLQQRTTTIMRYAVQPSHKCTMPFRTLRLLVRLLRRKDSIVRLWSLTAYLNYFIALIITPAGL